MVHRLLSRLRRDQRGFTLVEQLVVIGCMSFIIAAIVGVMEMAQQVVPGDTERSHQVRTSQTGLDRMSRELRHAYALTVTGGNVVDANVAFRNRTYSVKYDCSLFMPGSTTVKRCVRSETGGSAATETVIENVVNPSTRPVFTATDRDATSGTTYVRAAVEVKASGTRKAGQNHRVVLEDGFYLRNRDAALN
jgi:type II secretory pathway pseudopilin PulG